jgi:hypothetical protein
MPTILETVNIKKGYGEKKEEKRTRPEGRVPILSPN